MVLWRNLMSNDQLLWWFKDKILGDITDPTDYFEQTVNIEVDKLVNPTQYDQFVRAVVDGVTDRMYSEHGNFGQAMAYKFYGRILALSNLDKIKFLYKVIGD